MNLESVFASFSLYTTLKVLVHLLEMILLVDLALRRDYRDDEHVGLSDRRTRRDRSSNGPGTGSAFLSLRVSSSHNSHICRRKTCWPGVKHCTHALVANDLLAV